MHTYIELMNGLGEQINELCTSEKFDTDYFSGDKSFVILQPSARFSTHSTCC